MQEWVIAMLVISVLLILRDMAKTILSGRMSKKEEELPLRESHPQKEKVERYAASFRKLADTFYGMPYRKDYLSSGQTEKILNDTSRQMCTGCYHREICWGEHGESLLKGGKAMIRALEEGDMEKAEDIRHTLGNKEIYQKRKETIERIFGTAKEHHGFRYTQYIFIQRNNIFSFF